MCTGGFAGSTGTTGTGGSVGTGGASPGTAGATGAAGAGGAIDAAAGANGQNDGGHPDSAPPMDANSTIPDGGARDSGALDGYSGRLVTVTLEDCVVGPAKVDGTSWDPGLLGGDTIPPKVISDVAAALGAAAPYATVIGILGGPALTTAIDAIQKPDVYGTVRLDAFGMVGTEYWLIERGQEMGDDYTPAFPDGSIYEHVPIDSDVRIRFNLADDDDIGDDDEIGIAVVNSTDLKAALAAQKKYEVTVADQTQNQLLFIGISVIAE